MAETIVAVIGMVIFAAISVLGHHFATQPDASSVPAPFLLAIWVMLICGPVGTIYFMVRFVRWAWFTPIPFMPSL